MTQLSVSECRQLLGNSAIGFTDEAISGLRQQLADLAAVIVVEYTNFIADPDDPKFDSEIMLLGMFGPNNEDEWCSQSPLEDYDEKRKGHETQGGDLRACIVARSS